MLRHRKQPATLLPALLLAACASSGSALERSRQHAADGNYYLAYTVLEGLRDPGNPDAELEEAYWQARLDYLIDEGRRKLFEDHETEALVDLNQALALSPGNPVVLDLMERAQRKLADRAAARGDDYFRKDHLDLALLGYAEALQLVPGHAAAVEGTAKVRTAFGKMHARAQQHFLEAVRKFPQLRMVEVDWHAMAALENDPSRDDARELQEKAKRALAEEAFARAKACEGKGAYGAALMEYRSARKLFAGLTGIDERIAHMEKEVEAEIVIERAYMKLLNQDFDLARELLDQAFAITLLEKARVSELMLQARRRKAQTRYEAARDLELQGMKQEALEVFRALAAEWPDGLEDEKVRIYNLETDIGLAEKAYAAGAAAEEQGEWQKAADHYATALSYCAGFRDAKDRLQKAKARLQ